MNLKNNKRLHEIQMEAKAFAMLRRRIVWDLFGQVCRQSWGQIESERDSSISVARQQHPFGPCKQFAKAHESLLDVRLSERLLERENQIQMDSIQQRIRSKVNHSFLHIYIKSFIYFKKISIKRKFKQIVADLVKYFESFERRSGYWILKKYIFISKKR